MNTFNSSNSVSTIASALSSKPRNIPLFSLGKIVATPAVVEHFNKNQLDFKTYLEMHVHGEWGSLTREDALENDFAVQNGYRILSAYITPPGEKIWVITEADRSVTTFLRPEDY